MNLKRFDELKQPPTEFNSDGRDFVDIPLHFFKPNERVLCVLMTPYAKASATVILLGFAYLHRIGFAHANIEPEHLLLRLNPGKPPQVVITSFYNARQLTRTHSFALFTTEAAKYQDADLRKVDVWAAGVTLYQVAFSKNPLNELLKEGNAEKIKRALKRALNLRYGNQ
ncbi:hypothetical protein BDF19DRAFT_444961 [Syncephalis fuscata]|nr:hypothetical protein BDF19DRAFT_444961 [Syncephalis fuscata]